MKKRQGVKKDTVRAMVRNLVHGPSYMTFEDAVADFPTKHINTRPPNVAYSPWHLLEHMRLAQRDILDYIRDPGYRLPNWPEDYWPRPEAEADAKAWKKTVAAFLLDRTALEKIAANQRTSLSAPLPHAPKHTLIRELAIVAEHNTYHIAEFAILRQVMGTWPARR
jgi:hypothetical protein